jgi:hypothetical protein
LAQAIPRLHGLACRSSVLGREQLDDLDWLDR